MKFSLLFMFFLFLFACQTKEKPNVEVLFETDLSFSAASVKMGYNKAFIEYAHPNAVLLRENSMPIIGKPELSKIFENPKTNGIQFTWEPINGEIALSGELGFTYGIYTLKMDTLVEKGTYVSIWKKDDNGEWKYILDSGNKGIGEE